MPSVTGRKISWIHRCYRLFSQVLRRCEGIYFDDEQSRLEHHWILDQLVSLKKERMKVLDLGCGTGLLLLRLNKKFSCCKSYGIDLNTSALCIAGRHNGSFLVRSSAERPPFRSGSFDVIVCQNLLHHLAGGTRQSSFQKAELVIHRTTGLLKRDGYLIIIEQCLTSRFLSHLFFLFSSLLAMLDYQPKVSFSTPHEIYRFFETPMAHTYEQTDRSVFRWFVRVFAVWARRIPNDDGTLDRDSTHTQSDLAT